MASQSWVPTQMPFASLDSKGLGAGTVVGMVGEVVVVAIAVLLRSLRWVYREGAVGYTLVGQWTRELKCLRVVVAEGAWK